MEENDDPSPLRSAAFKRAAEIDGVDARNSTRQTAPNKAGLGFQPVFSFRSFSVQSFEDVSENLSIVMYKARKSRFAG
jgi:hypothetical protein